MKTKIKERPPPNLYKKDKIEWKNEKSLLLNRDFFYSVI